MKLNDDTFSLYAAKYYDNPQCSSQEEFEDDLKRFQYIKRLFNRYEKNGNLKTRLILNHIIVLYNCFGLATTEMLFFKLNNHYHILKPFLIQLNFLPEEIEIEGIKMKTTDISIDPSVVKELRKI